MHVSLKDPKVVANAILLVLSTISALGVNLGMPNESLQTLAALLATALNGVAHGVQATKDSAP